MLLYSHSSKEARLCLASYSMWVSFKTIECLLLLCSGWKLDSGGMYGSSVDLFVVLSVPSLVHEMLLILRSATSICCNLPMRAFLGMWTVLSWGIFSNLGIYDLLCDPVLKVKCLMVCHQWHPVGRGVVCLTQWGFPLIWWICFLVAIWTLLNFQLLVPYWKMECFCIKYLLCVMYCWQFTFQFQPIL